MTKDLTNSIVALYALFARYVKLVQIDSVATLEELNIPPGNRLEALTGDRAGLHSLRINDQWRICFRWESDGVYDVQFVDYP